MRHRKGFNHLGRTSAHRKAMLSNMASSLILHKRITTTTAKAKALRTYIEPLITRSKDDTTHSRRVVFSYLKNKYAVSELFREVSPKIMDRPGGYTRILKTGNRLGDNAEMCIIELVDYNENMLEDTSKKARSTRRRRGSGKAKAEVQEAVADDVETTADAGETPHDAGEAPRDAEDLKSEAQEEVKEVKAEASASAEATADKKAEVKEEGKAEAGKPPHDAEDLQSEAQEETKAEVKAESKKEAEEKQTGEGKSENTDKEEDKKK